MVICWQKQCDLCDYVAIGKNRFGKHFWIGKSNLLFLFTHFNEQKEALRLYNCSSFKLMQIGYVINQYAAFASRERFEYNYKF